MKIRQRRSKRGTVSWQVDFGTASGRRVQRSYKSREAAEAAMKAGVKARKRFGVLGQALNPSDVAEFILARERLAGVSVIAAVEFYLAHAKVVREPVSMPELVRRFIDAKERQGRRERYVGQLPVSLGSFARSVELKQAHEVEKEDVEAWLHGNGWAPKTRNNYLGAVKTLFAWAVRMRHAAKNPCDEVERCELPDSEIEVLTCDEASALLHMALEAKHRPMLAFVGDRLVLRRAAGGAAAHALGCGGSRGRHVDRGGAEGEDAEAAGGGCAAKCAGVVARSEK